MVKISIIVPVYNVERYLEKCIESLIQQTLKEIEIIIINDASPDKSNIIMEQYRKKYPDKIKCIYLQENLSQGGARNEGIKASSGKYITFVDSDDYIDITMCEQLYKKAEETDSDVVFCDIYKVSEETNKKKHCSLVYMQQMGNITQEKREQLFLMESFPWAKIIRRNIIMNNNILFPLHMKYEDCATVSLYYAYIYKCSYIRKPLYFYLLRNNSTTTIKKGKQNIDNIQASRLLYKRMINRGIYDRYPDAADMASIKGWLRGLGMPKAWEEPDLKQIYNISQKLKNEFPYMEKNKFYNLDYDIDVWRGKYVLEQSSCPYEEFLDKYNSGELSFKNIGYKIYYIKHREKIKILISYLHGKKIALWGAGKKGIDFLKILDRSGSFISAVIDSDKNKWGQELETKHKIIGFDNCASELDGIIVINNVYFSDIYNYVKKYKFNDIFLINLDAFIALGIKENIENFIEK